MKKIKIQDFVAIFQQGGFREELKNSIKSGGQYSLISETQLLTAIENFISAKQKSDARSNDILGYESWKSKNLVSKN